MPREIASTGVNGTQDGRPKLVALRTEIGIFGVILIKQKVVAIFVAILSSILPTFLYKFNSLEIPHLC